MHYIAVLCKLLKSITRCSAVCPKSCCQLYMPPKAVQISDRHIALHCFTKREEQSTTLKSTRVCGVYKRPLEMSLEAGFTATPPMCPGYSLQELLFSDNVSSCFLILHLISTKTARKLNFSFHPLMSLVQLARKFNSENNFCPHPTAHLSTISSKI